MVASKDPLTGKQSAKRVLYTFRRLAPVVLTMTLGNGESIGTTPGHPFATSSQGHFVLAGNLPLQAQLQEFGGQTTTRWQEPERARHSALQMEMSQLLSL